MAAKLCPQCGGELDRYRGDNNSHKVGTGLCQRCGIRVIIDDKGHAEAVNENDAYANPIPKVRGEQSEPEMPDETEREEAKELDEKAHTVTTEAPTPAKR